MLTYTTRGNVRGSCGHQHRSVEAAQRCQDRDSRACRSVGGYSDRYIFASAAPTGNDWEQIAPGIYQTTLILDGQYIYADVRVD